MSYLIYRAGSSDHRAVMELCQEAKGNFDKFEVDLEFLSKNMKDLLKAPYSYAYCAKKGGKVIGIIVGNIVKPIWSARYFLDVQFIYVSEEHRSMSLTYKLIKVIENEVRATDADPVATLVRSDFGGKGADVCFNVIGFKSTGRGYYRSLED